MPPRNGDHGYGWVTKLLHWATVVALLAQLGVGLTMEADAAAERAEEDAEAGEEAAEELGGEQGEAAEDAADAEADRAADVEYRVGLDDGFDLLDVHVGLGLTIMVIGVARLVWRRVGGLPPWSPALSAAERTAAGWIEKALLTCLFLVPGSGLVLLASQDDGWLALHVGAQLLLALAVAAHLTLVLRHTVLRRDRLLQRML